LSTTTQADLVLHHHGDLFVALGVSVQDQQRRVCSRLQRGDDLAATGYVEAESLLDHYPLDGGARKRLGGEDDSRSRPARRELIGVLPCPGAKRLLRHDEHRCLELGRELVGAAPADQEHPVGGQCTAGRVQGQQSVHAGVTLYLRRLEIAVRTTKSIHPLRGCDGCLVQPPSKPSRRGSPAPSRSWSPDA
jgi:hypothetical protein